MLRTTSTTLQVLVLRRRRNVSSFSSSSAVLAAHPNPPLNLDPSLQALLKDVDMSLSNRQSRPPPRELEVYPTDQPLSANTEAILLEEQTPEEDLRRKSPAAHFGSQHIGAVVLPNQMQTSINGLIAEADKPQLHNDAKRLFYDSESGKGSDNDWATHFDAKYRSRHQASRRSERDGTAFASVALPAHYSAITSVLDHVKRRLGPTWKAERVIDWGTGTGSGLWACLYSFQKPSSLEKETGDSHDTQGLKASNSTLASYLGIDKRDGLVTIGKRLVRNVDTGSVSLSWQKSFKEENKIQRSEGHEALALSAFMLTSLPTPLARKALVKEMWESGAHLMILIDHSTTAGFEAIAEARETLLKMGEKEFSDPETHEWPIRGSHVVAPCPHDGACPLHHSGSTRLVCGFAQRLQRPSFIRLTKHSGVGHEDIGYSYVVIQRGPRPPTATTKVGRIGEVGRWAMDREVLSRAEIKELVLHDEHETAPHRVEEVPIVAASESIISTDTNEGPEPRTELESALRLEAYSWPRLVFPPLKKSGHIILDSCTAEGKIIRMTIPRSQGKQAFYDARKSSWGDIFPHAPKNPPQERYQPLRTKREGDTTPTKGADIGKRRDSNKDRDRHSYEVLAKGLKEQRVESRKKTRRAKADEPQED